MQADRTGPPVRAGCERCGVVYVCVGLLLKLRDRVFTAPGGKLPLKSSDAALAGSAHPLGLTADLPSPAGNRKSTKPHQLEMGHLRNASARLGETAPDAVRRFALMLFGPAANTSAM